MAVRSEESSPTAARTDLHHDATAVTQRGLSPALLCAAAGAVLYLGVMAAILVWNRGTLTYSLDDPYIHLAMAENLLSGHYGINTAEPSAPASSILYPALLAPLLLAGLASWAPAVVNFVATVANFWLIQRLLVRSGLGPPRFTPVASACLGIFVGVSFNLLGVAFTGMEHPVQIFVTLLALYGLVSVSEGRAPAAWLWIVLALAPLIRFEGLAIAVPALAALFLLGYRRRAAITFGVIVLTIAGYMALLVRLGLPPLPTSILMKSDVTASAIDTHAPLAIARMFVGNALVALQSRPGAILAVLTVVVATRAFLPDVRKNPRRLTLPVVVTIAAILHFFAGRFGWFERYEIYMMLFVFMAAVYVWRAELSGLAQRSRAAVGGAFAALLLINAPYVQATALTPLAARNIYEQQYQMHRFVVDFYRAPVAVNDLGWVSFHNPYYVLDLWGLGSEEARRARVSGSDAAWMQVLAERHDVGLAIVYEDWFPQGLPANWTRVARLHMASMRVTPARAYVDFYVTPLGDAAKVRADLEQFQTTLPAGLRLNFFDAQDLRRGEPAPTDPGH